MSLRPQGSLPPATPTTEAGQLASAQHVFSAASPSSAKESSPATAQQCGVQCPTNIRLRHGDRLRQGFAGNWRQDPSAPAWRRIATPVEALVTRPQFLESELGVRVRNSSRRMLAKARLYAPGLEFTKPEHCFHAMFEPGILSVLYRKLNTNLALSSQRLVTSHEFRKWICMFLLRCVVPGLHPGLVHQVSGANPATARNLLTADRYRVIARHFKLLASNRVHDEAVCQLCAATPIQLVPTNCDFGTGRGQRNRPGGACDQRALLQHVLG